MWGSVATWLFPASKLQAEFPWDIQTAGKRYMSALFYFAIGSFVVPLMVLAPIWAMAYYEQTLLSMVETSSAIQMLCLTMTLGVVAAGGTYLLWLRRKRQKLTFSNYARLGAYAVIGGLTTTLILMLSLWVIDPYYKRIITWMVEILCDKDGKPQMSFVMSLSLVSFVCGFGMQMWYIARSLRKEGQSFATVMGLTLEPRRGSRWFITLFKVVWPVALAYLIFWPIGEAVVYVLGESHQPTVELAKQATGHSFVMFALMAAVGAPILEELVFRGFLFQVIAGSLKREPGAVKLATVPQTGWFLAVRQPLVHFENCVRQALHNWSVYARKLLGGPRAELAAVVISSMLFSLLHMQFNPTTLVLLFLLGCVHAELYRRTGSLYCSMLLHATNNGYEVFKLAIGG